MFAWPDLGEHRRSSRPSNGPSVARSSSAPPRATLPREAPRGLASELAQPGAEAPATGPAPAGSGSAISPKSSTY